jgi:branched-chain amino acid transport system permease protein
VITKGLESWRNVLVLALIVFILVILPPIIPSYVVMLMTQSLVYSIVAMSLDLLIGYSALRSLGHGAFFAIGAYTTGILVIRLHVGFFTSLLASIGMGAGSSALVALLTLRAAGIYFLLITLAIAMCVWGLIYRWVSLTGGDNGIMDIPRPDIGIGLNFLDPMYFYYFVLLFFAICLILIYLLVRSPFGRTLVGIRDSESRMKVLGYNVWLHKYMVLIIAGAFAGVGGNLYAYYNRFVGPNDGDLVQCMEFVLMVSIGGQGTLIGPNIGAFVITLLKNMVSVYTKRWLMILAFIYILSAKYAPEGFMGLLRRLKPKERVA